VIGDPNVADVTEDSSPTTPDATGSIRSLMSTPARTTSNTTVTPGAANLGRPRPAGDGSYTYPSPTPPCSPRRQQRQCGTATHSTPHRDRADGTSKLVSFTIHGTKRRRPVIGDPNVADVTEDSSPTPGRRPARFDH